MKTQTPSLDRAPDGEEQPKTAHGVTRGMLNTGVVGKRGRRGASQAVRRHLTGARDVHVVGQNIDTLILNVRYADETGSPMPHALDDDLALELASSREQAQEAGENVLTHWTFKDAPLQMWKKSRSHFAWALSCGYFELYVDMGVMTGVIAQVKFSSAYLWSGWYVDAVADVEMFLMGFFGQTIHLQVSEVHLATDVAGLAIDTLPWQQILVGRTRKRKPTPGDAVPQREPATVNGVDDCDYYGSRLETLTFGTHGSQISAQIYNKSVEMVKHDKGFFAPIWADNGHDGVSAVWRLEIRLRRRVLGQFGVDDPYDLDKQIASLWCYLVGSPEDQTGWLRMVLPDAGDTNRARWQTAPLWRHVQTWNTHAASAHGDLVEVQRVEKQEKDIRRAEAAIIGYSTSMAAWMVQQKLLREMDDFSVVLTHLARQGDILFTRKQTDYRAELRRKMLRYGIPLEVLPEHEMTREEVGLDPFLWPNWELHHTAMAPSIRYRLEEQRAFEAAYGPVTRSDLAQIDQAFDAMKEVG